jgi:hypothetical protein
MRKSFSSCVSVVIVLAFSCVPSFAQGYGITAQAQVYSGLDSYWLGTAEYSPGCIVNASNPLDNQPYLF